MIACCENGPYILEDGKWKKLNAPKATDSAGH